MMSFSQKQSRKANLVVQSMVEKWGRLWTIRFLQFGILNFVIQLLIDLPLDCLEDPLEAWENPNPVKAGLFLFVW